MLNEEPIAEIVFLQLVGRGDAAVGPSARRRRLDDGVAVALTHAGVVEGIDVDGQTLGMLRQLLRSGNGAKAEARRVVGSHGALVVSLKVVNELHAADGIAGVVELSEDVEQVVGNQFVADELALMHASVGIVVQHAQIAEVLSADGASVGEGPSSHALECSLSDGVGREALVLLLSAGRERAEHRCDGYG